jgi:hypothetical protein
MNKDVLGYTDDAPYSAGLGNATLPLRRAKAVNLGENGRLIYALDHIVPRVVLR